MSISVPSLRRRTVSKCSTPVRRARAPARALLGATVLPGMISGSTGRSPLPPCSRRSAPRAAFQEDDAVEVLADDRIVRDATMPPAARLPLRRLRSPMSRAIFDAPIPCRPRPDRRTVSDTGTSAPSLWRRTVSKCSIRMPARMRARTCLPRARRAAGMIVMIDCPMIRRRCSRTSARPRFPGLTSR